MRRRFSLPSLVALAVGARGAAVRFPAPALAAVVATAAGFQFIGADGNSEPALRLLTSALLGLSLGTALTVTLERWAGTGAPRAVEPLAALAGTALVCGGFWLGWPRWTETIVWTRFFHFAVLFHLLVACLPFLGRKESNAFWQFNRLILTRWLLGGVYAATLFFGLALALAALDNLFGIDVHERVYGRLWVTMAFLFHPLFFLADVPRDFAMLEQDRTHPAVLRAFANFVLVPLTILYLAIVSAYFVKILATGTWPSGWIGWLVSGAATVGILTLLLASPPGATERPAWVASFERWFWPGLLPAVVMVGLAVWKRIAQYGFTERRYFLAVLALWLGAVTVLFMLRRSRRLLVIPASLAAVALVTFGGPWSAYRVSERSQLGRLTVLLTQLEMMDEGGITPAGAAVDRGLAAEAANVARYLATTHGSRRFGRWLELRDLPVPPSDSTAPAAPLPPGERDRQFAADVLRALGLERFQGRTGEWLWISGPSHAVVEVRGWDYLLGLDEKPRPDTTQHRGDTLVAAVRGDRRSIEVRRRGAGPLLVVDLGPALDEAAAWRWRNRQGEVPESLLSVHHEAGDVAAMVRLRQLGLRDSAGAWRANQVQGEVFLRLRPPN